MHILFVTSEVVPFSTNGAAGEHVGMLARAVREAGHSVTILTPHYSEATGDRFGLARRIRKFQVPTGNTRQVEVGLLDGKFPGSDVQVLFVDHPPSFLRDGIYGDDSGPYADNHLRFNLLCRSAPAIADELELAPDVVHAFDWQAALLPLMIRRGEAGGSLARSKTIFTVHDPAAGGPFSRGVLDELGLAPDLFTPDGLEFHGQINLLKAGLIGADMICTTSPSHARELCTEQHGAGLHGLFQALGPRLCGVMDGIDYNTWDPGNDYRIAARYDIDSLGSKAECKRALQAELQLPTRPEIPLALVFAPFTPQRGFDLLLEGLAQLPTPQLQLVLVGGETEAMDRVPQPTAGNVAHHPAIDLDAAHRMLAGADLVCMPFEHDQGGDLQLRAMRYGTIVMGCRVGRLHDSVVDFDPRTGTGTGIVIHNFNVDSLVSAIHRTVSLHSQAKPWDILKRNAMRQRFPLDLMGHRYLELYQGLLGQA